MHYKMQENRVTHSSPHEMLTGRPMPVPRMRGLYGGPSLKTLELELKQYVKQLTVIHETIYAQEREEENPEKQHQLKPGDLVYVRKFRRRWNEPRREGPFRITTTSPTALQVEGSSVWYHLNHCTRAIDNRLDGQGGSDDEPDGEATEAAGPSGEGAATAESPHPAEDDVQTNADSPSSSGSAGGPVVDDQVRSVQRGKQGREKIQTQLPLPPLTSGTSPPLTLGPDYDPSPR